MLVKLIVLEIDMIQSIKTIEDVKAFFHYLIWKRDINFHPDDDFADVLDDPGEISLFNNLMNQCFYICEKYNMDIYDIAYDELKLRLHQLYGTRFN